MSAAFSKTPHQRGISLVPLPVIENKYDHMFPGFPRGEAKEFCASGGLEGIRCGTNNFNVPHYLVGIPLLSVVDQTSNSKGLGYSPTLSAIDSNTTNRYRPTLTTRFPAVAGTCLVCHHDTLPRQTWCQSRSDAGHHSHTPHHNRRMLPLMFWRSLAWILRSRDTSSGLWSPLCVFVPQELGRHDHILTLRRRRTIRLWGKPRRPGNISAV